MFRQPVWKPSSESSGSVSQLKIQTLWDAAACLTYSTDYYQRITLESWFTNLEQTALNRCQPLPAPYKRLPCLLFILHPMYLHNLSLHMSLQSIKSRNYQWLLYLLTNQIAH